MTYSKLTHESFDSMLDKADSGDFAPTSESLLRSFVYHGVTYFEDFINGYTFPSFYRNDYHSAERTRIETRATRQPLIMTHSQDVQPNTMFKPDGREVKKTHLEKDAAYVTFPNSNIILSASHNRIDLQDYKRGANESDPSETINNFSLIYLIKTQTLLYDPKPIIAHEPDPDLKALRYQYISELFPIAKMYCSLHTHDSTVEKYSRHYNQQEGIDAISNLYDAGYKPSEIPEIAANDVILENQDRAKGALTFLAKHMESEVKGFNNWVNGIVKNEYPFLLYNEPT